MNIGHLYQNIPNGLPVEVSECLLQSQGIKIERIVSRGHCSEPGVWYDQEDREWVVLLQGEATLQFSDGNRRIHLTPGMYVNIAAHEKHRVEWTADDRETIWLAIFY